MAGKYRVSTLGCKVNQYESQQLREVLESCGLTPALPWEHPHIAVVNTCAVTASAVSKSRQAIRREARNGRTHVIVVGCAASAEADRLAGIPGVVAVLGHDHDTLRELRRFVAARLTILPAQPAATVHNSPNTPVEYTEVPGTKVWMNPGVSPGQWEPEPADPSPFSIEIIPAAPRQVKQENDMIARIERFDGHQRAFLKIQDGCDAHCTYCIIPRLRPVLRSKPVEVAVAEARRLVQAGHREIILTGIFLGAYGRETAIRKRFSAQTSPLAILLDALARIEGLERLRLSSLEPGDLTDDLLEVVAAHDVCVPHFHLPLQSGSAEILRRMNRQYTRDNYLAMIDRLRAVLDEPAVSTDIIVGFPGESDDDFEASIEIARYVPFCKIHAFPFSPREGTAAVRWQRSYVPQSVVRERMNRLEAVDGECSLIYRRRLVGRTERVIVEASGSRPSVVADPPVEDSSPAMVHGRADRYFSIHFEANNVRPSDVVQVRIDRVTPVCTHGSLVSRTAGFIPTASLIASLKSREPSPLHAPRIPRRYAATATL